MVDYYDLLLGVIAAVLAAGWVIGLVTGVSLEVAMAGSVALATPLVYEALFRNPPLPANTRQVAAAVVWHAVLAVALLAAFL